MADHHLVSTRYPEQASRSKGGPLRPLPHDPGTLAAVTLLAVDPDNDGRWLEVRGTVIEETEEGANEHIDELARLYMGVDK